MPQDTIAENREWQQNISFESSSSCVFFVLWVSLTFLSVLSVFQCFYANHVWTGFWMGHLSARFAYMLVKNTCSHICSHTFNLRFSVSPHSVPMQPEQQDAQVRNACFTMSPAMQSDDLKSHQQDCCSLTFAVVGYIDEGDGLHAEVYLEFKTPVRMCTLGRRLSGANSRRRSGTAQRAAHSCRQGTSCFCTCASREQSERSDVLRKPAPLDSLAVSLNTHDISR